MNCIRRWHLASRAARVVRAIRTLREGGDCARYGALRSLRAHLEREEVIEAVQRATRDHHFLIRRRAIELLATVRHPSLADIVTPMLSDRSPWVQIQAATALYRAGYAVDLHQVLCLVKNRYSSVAGMAADLLGEAADRSLLLPLCEAIRDVFPADTDWEEGHDRLRHHLGAILAIARRSPAEDCYQAYRTCTLVTSDPSCWYIPLSGYWELRQLSGLDLPVPGKAPLPAPHSLPIASRESDSEEPRELHRRDLPHLGWTPAGMRQVRAWGCSLQERVLRFRGHVLWWVRTRGSSRTGQ